MNSTMNVLNNHRSVREFDSGKDVSEEMVKAIIQAAMAAPNWMNGQQVSVIEVRDPVRKSTLAKACGNQKWIEEAPVFLVFCIDFYRAKIASEKNGTNFAIAGNVEALLIGATDVGIALECAVAAAESLGLGTVPIGGVRRNPQILVELLELPEYVFPISGLVIGHPRNTPRQKPRLPLQATFHKERYNAEIQKEMIDQYDDTYSSYLYERTGGKDSSSWSNKIARFCDMGFEQYAKNSGPSIKNQGFHFK